MKLTSNQVAEKLGLKSSSSIKSFVKSGKLHDLRAEISGRHSYLFDSKEVNEFAKTYTNRKKTNNHTEIQSSPIGFISRIESKIDSLESKIDKLIQLWN